MSKYLVQWLGGIALWFLFAYQLSTSELLAGALCSALAVVALNVSLRSAPLRFSPRPVWFLQLAVLPGAIAKDMFVIVRAILRRIAGKPIGSGFQQSTLRGITSGIHAPAKRALAVALTSVSPNSVVADVESKRRLIVFHQLEKTALPDTLEELEHP